MNCTPCGDEGWVNIEHPVRPGVIAWRVPCELCNPGGGVPDPWPDPEFTISIEEDERIDGLANSTTIISIGVTDDDSS